MEMTSQVVPGRRTGDRQRLTTVMAQSADSTGRVERLTTGKCQAAAVNEVLVNSAL